MLYVPDCSYRHLYISPHLRGILAFTWESAKPRYNYFVTRRERSNLWHPLLLTIDKFSMENQTASLQNFIIDNALALTFIYIFDHQKSVTDKQKRVNFFWDCIITSLLFSLLFYFIFAVIIFLLHPFHHHFSRKLL